MLNLRLHTFKVLTEGLKIFHGFLGLFCILCQFGIIAAHEILILSEKMVPIPSIMFQRNKIGQNSSKISQMRLET